MKTRYHSMDAEDDEQDPSAPRLRRRGGDAEYVLGEETLVGRGLECDILISDSDSISRRHAQVFSGAEGLFVMDLGSTNGTHVNGTEVTERTALADGDVLAFDEYEFDVVIPPPPPPPQADPEVTRLVSRDETMTRADRLALETLADAGEARPDATPEATSEPVVDATPGPTDRDAPDASLPAPDAIGTSGDASPLENAPDRARTDDGSGDEGLPERSVVDEMGDDRSWPEIEDDAREPALGLDDDHAPAEPASSVPSAPSVPESEAPAEARAPADKPASAGRPETPRGDAASREPAPRDAAPREASRPADAPAASDAAAVPGAWANAADVQGAAGHTMIVKYVAPRREAPPPIDPESLDGPALVVGTDDPAGEVLPLDAGVTEWIVGSGDDCDLFIDDDGVSKRHAVLSREGNKWRLCDELSANGTYVNGNRLNIGYVGDGDALRFGSVECRLVIPKGKGAKAKRGKPARARKADAGAAPAAAAGQAPSAPFPWKPVLVTLAVVLVLAIAAAAAFFFLAGA